MREIRGKRLNNFLNVLYVRVMFYRKINLVRFNLLIVINNLYILYM